MRLSDLKTGDEAYIVKVKGHGGFRKRVVEMGFIKGQRVDVLQSAPLQDPVKYKVMGYEVSLRRQEAEKIEVTQDEREAAGISEPQNVASTAHYAKHSARHTINVALVGNPNCGKTSLFNFASGAHERVGNYSGVTVDAKEGFTGSCKGALCNTSTRCPLMKPISTIRLRKPPCPLTLTI